MKPEFLYRKYTFIVWKWLKMFYSKYCPSLDFTFFPPVWQLVDVTPKKLSLFWGKPVIESFSYILSTLKALWFTKSMLIVSFDKHSMRFCNSFLQMVTENQCCPQIVVSRHKIRHVQRYYKLCCCMKLVLFRVENVCEMSTKTFGINDAV